MRPSDMRASHADREHFAEMLRQAAGDGRIDIDELEERLEQVFAAKTYGELEPIVRDLPAARPSAAPATQPVPLSNVSERVGGVATSENAVAIFGGAERNGMWVVPRKFTAVAIFGGVDIDLTQARFEGREIQIDAVAIFGGIDIKVPEDVTVRVDGSGIFGGFGGANLEGAPGGAVVRVTGVAIFGGVDVKRPKNKNKKPKALDQ